MNHLQYLKAHSNQTFEEAIKEMRAYELELQNDYSETMAPELARDMDEHDAIHALFACTTDLKGEILAHVWTMFGTTMTMEQMKRVNQHKDHKKALKEIGHFKLLGTWLLILPSIIKVIRNAKRMNQQFPIGDYPYLLQSRLCDLREEFGIKI